VNKAQAHKKLIAVLALNQELLSEIPQRLAAVRAFSTLAEAPAFGRRQ